MSLHLNLNLKRKCHLGNLFFVKKLFRVLIVQDEAIFVHGACPSFRLIVVKRNFFLQNKIHWGGCGNKPLIRVRGSCSYRVRPQSRGSKCEDTRNREDQTKHIGDPNTCHQFPMFHFTLYTFVGVGQHSNQTSAKPWAIKVKPTN